MKEVKVPVLPESINEATVALWHKKLGDYVEVDDVIVEIETDKVVLEVPAEEVPLIQKELVLSSKVKRLTLSRFLLF